MNKFFQNVKKGFTLVELLIVIIIIAVLAGIVLVMLNPAEQRARAGATTLKANVAAVCRAQALCLVEAATPGLCAAWGAGATEIPNPEGNPAGSTYVWGGSPDYAITGAATLGGTTFTVTCNNLNDTTKGEAVCTESAGGTYTCAQFGL